MNLNLKRPIVFFDLETTGVDTAKDRIVEISMVKVMPDGEEITRTRRINPQMHIPEQATAIHGIKDEDVANEPTFAQIAKSLVDEVVKEARKMSGSADSLFNLSLKMQNCGIALEQMHYEADLNASCTLESIVVNLPKA